MDLSVKRKKTSIAISLIDFILGLGVTGLYIMAVYAVAGYTGFNFSDVMEVAKGIFSAFDFSAVATYLVLLVYFFPLISSLISLIFGRAARWVNVFTFASFLVTSIYYVLSCTSFAKLFDFSTLATTYLSSGLICALLGLLLSFINLEKSK